MPRSGFEAVKLLMVRTEAEKVTTHVNARYLVKSNDGAHLEIRYVFQIERN